MKHFYETIHGWFSFAPIYVRMVDHFPDGARFVEVGSWYGRSTAYMAVEIINSGKLMDFYAVDTWEGSAEHQKGAFAEDKIIAETGTIYEAFTRNMKSVLYEYMSEPKVGVVFPLKMTSLKAAAKFDDRSLDFVFIDAAHDYDNVKADIEAWHPKVKIGGFIGGHDYTPSWPGVKQAVDEFYSGKHAVSFAFDSWLVRKNK